MPGWTASGSFSHAFYSDGGAAGPWNRVVSEGHYLFGFPRTQWTSAQVGQDPATGYLYFSSGASPPNISYIWQSTNNGTSWAATNATGGWLSGVPLSPGIDNGTTLYALGPSNLYVPGSNINNSDGGWNSDLLWPAPGMSNDMITRKAIIADDSVFYFALDQVALSSSLNRPAWHFNVHWST